jgi:hypothetical protein
VLAAAENPPLLVIVVCVVSGLASCWLFCFGFRQRHLPWLGAILSFVSAAASLAVGFTILFNPKGLLFDNVWLARIVMVGSPYHLTRVSLIAQITLSVSAVLTLVDWLVKETEFAKAWLDHYDPEWLDQYHRLVNPALTATLTL